jgi:hypothetical protein
MTSRNLYLEAAEYDGYELDYAEGKLEDYLFMKGAAASIEGFVNYLDEYDFIK